MADPKEITESVEDTEETKVSEDSAEEQETSTDTVEEEEAAEAPEQKEAPEKEDSLEEKINRVAQSRTDKALKTYQQKASEQTKTIAEQEKQIAELTRLVNAKEWDKATLALLEEETESKGEELALKNKAHRENLKKQVLEYQENADKVNQTLKLLGGVKLETYLQTLGKSNLEEAVNFLDDAAKTQKAREAAWAIEFPEDKEKLSKIQANTERLMKAQDQTHFDLILESIKSERKGTKARQKFSGNTQEGSSNGIDGLTPVQLIAKGLKEENKKHGG